MLNRSLARSLLLTALSTATISFHSTVFADSPKERIALMLTGSDCRGALQTLILALQQTDGVFAIDGDSVPGHLLIDVEAGKTSARDMRTVAQTAISTPLSCQVEIMQSCITASKHAGVTVLDK